MSVVLALETATEALSVALAIDGAVLARHEIAPRRHGERVLPLCQELLAESGLARSAIDAIAAGRGPGAFTGVRLAIAIAQGLALAWARPVVPISTLAALAEPYAHGGQAVCAALDARMGEVYVGWFGGTPSGLVALAAEAVCAPQQVDPPQGLAQWIGVGTGYAACAGALAERQAAALHTCDAAALPTATAVARLAQAALARGEAIDAALLQPVYLRDKVAETPAERAARMD